MKTLVTIGGVLLFCGLGLAEERPIAGAWSGAIDGLFLRLVLHITKQPDGSLAATLDSPDQGAKGIPTSKVEYKGGALRVEVVGIGGLYEGAMSADGARIVGQWKQAGRSFGLTLAPGELAPLAKPNRPQEPKPPFPYDQEQVSYPSRQAGIKLAGTLTLPRGAGPFPAAILITGSGAQDRDETLLGHKPFWVVADYLTRRGIAVLRVDDRGVGGSTGNTLQSTTADCAQDVLGGVDFLKAHKKISPQRIGVVGHSEGGVIGPMAAESKDVAFVVMLAGIGISGKSILYMQEDVGDKAVAADPKLAPKRKLMEQTYAVLERVKDDAESRKQILALWEADFKKDDALKVRFTGTLPLIQSPWFRYFLTIDPTVALKKVRCPVLALIGEHDQQVTPAENLPAIEAALKGDKDVTVKMLPGLNHLFQTCTDGSPALYSKIEETISPVALTTVGDWIVAHTRQ